MYIFIAQGNETIFFVFIMTFIGHKLLAKYYKATWLKVMPSADASVIPRVSL